MGKGITDIIFDLDGTLIDSAPSILECFKRTLESTNIEPLYQLNSDLIGPPLSQTLSRLTGINESEALSKLVEEFKNHYDVSGYKSTIPFLGVGELLKECVRSGFRLHIATNKRLVPTALILNHLGWRQYFKSVYALDSSSPAFDNKTIMLSALLDAENIDRNYGVYVGDRVEDKDSAIFCDLHFFAAKWGYQDEKLTSDDGVISCGTIEQFLEYINI
ncbi:haloacid dehalogenase [Polynucleobacter paneuropaeus]|uniref:HAD family hydrolase n=1 Tax=Polynucleobacter paneuropaeus TaxID=2527775 RepID=UPI000DBEFFC9|nr:HAD hydrolase-like protein [Polynucleobacter paneuropaeus]AWW45653.1 haloacid dehalogenase [Polynucleobacter paneuropaeus]